MTKWFTIQNIYSNISSTSCDVDEIISNINWISNDENMTFPGNKNVSLETTFSEVIIFSGWELYRAL